VDDKQTHDQMAGRNLGQKPQCSFEESEEGESWFLILSRVTYERE